MTAEPPDPLRAIDAGDTLPQLDFYSVLFRELALCLLHAVGQSATISSGLRKLKSWLQPAFQFGN